MGDDRVRAAKAARAKYYELSALIQQLPHGNPVREAMASTLIELWRLAREAMEGETRRALGNLGGPRDG